MMPAARRGSAMILVLIMTLSLAGLAMSAIYMAGSSGILSRYHDKERDLSFALESALELGKSRLQRDTLLVLYDTGYQQLLTNQAVYTSDGTPLTGLTVNLYAGYTGDTSGVYVEYVTLLGTVSDANGVRLARRMDLYAQSFARYSLFTNDFPALATIGAGDNIPGRAHANNRFIGANAGATPLPVFGDTVSAAGPISGLGQWSDTISSAAGARVIPYPSATVLRPYYAALAAAGNLSYTFSAGSSTSAVSGNANVSGTSNAAAIYTGRVEFVTVDVNNNGMIDSTEGFMKVFVLWAGYGGDSTRLATNFNSGLFTLPGTTPPHIVMNQCGAFYTINGRREFFPVSMHTVGWVKARITSAANTYPTVSALKAGTMSATAGGYMTQAAIRTILQQPTARCFPMGSPYLMNVERFTAAGACAQTWPQNQIVQMYTWGSSPSCAASRQYGGQDTTFTQFIFTCVVDQNFTDGRCTLPSVTPPGPGFYDPVYEGEWIAYAGTSNVPTLPGAVRQDGERPFLYPLHRTYNPNSRGVVYLATSSALRRSIYLSGTVRGNLTVYVNGVATLIDDLVYDAEPTDTTNLCRNFFGLIAKDSIMVSDNAINRPRVYDTPAATAGYTLTLGGNRDFIFHGIAMALGGSVGAMNPGDGTSTNPVYTCPTASTFTASGGCLQVIGGTVMNTYSPPFTATANSGLRPLRERDPCQMQNRRPPYFPVAPTLVRPYKTFDVDVRQVNSSTLLLSYFTRLRGARPAP